MVLNGIIRGHVIDASTKVGVVGVIVEVWDEDRTNRLEAETTDQQGKFEVIVESVSDIVTIRIITDGIVITEYSEEFQKLTDKEVKIPIEMAEREIGEHSTRQWWFVGGEQVESPDRPPRKYPSILGRSHWFGNRAGSEPGSLSLERIQAARKHAADIPTSAEARLNTRSSANELLSLGSNYEIFEREDIIALNSEGKPIDVEIIPYEEPSLFGLFGPKVRVDDFETPGAILIIGLPENTGVYDWDSAILMHNPHDVSVRRLIRSATYSNCHDSIVATITEPGVFQPFGLPRNNWLRRILTTMYDLWPWMNAEDELDISPKTQNAVCDLTVCRDEWYDAEVSEALPKLGLGKPPEITEAYEFNGTICELCTSKLGLIEDVSDTRRKVPSLLDLVGSVDFNILGMNWEAIGPSPRRKFKTPSPFWGVGRISQIDIHPNGNVLIAGTSGGGVWQLENAPFSCWEPLMSEQPTLTIGAVGISPSNPNVLYTASGEDAGGFNPAWPGVGIYKSTDGGSNWELTSPVNSDRFSALVVHPTRPNTIFVAGNGGLHLSTDGGGTWQTPLLGHATDVVVAANNPNRLYVGLGNDGVYRSIDGGITFQRLNNPGVQLPSGANAGWIKLAIGVAGLNGSQFLAAKLGSDGSRIFTTTDGGNTWNEQASNVAPANFDEWTSIIAVNPQNENRLYAGADRELVRSDDGGDTWTDISENVHADQQDLHFYPGDPDTLILANDGGIQLSGNGGDMWVHASYGMQTSQVYDLDISHRDPDIVACGTQDNGVFYRNETGKWRHIRWSWDGTQVAIDPTDPRIFYFSSQQGVDNRANGGLARSRDGGQSIESLGTKGIPADFTSPWITILKIDPRDPIEKPAANRNVFVGAEIDQFRQRLLHSTNGGKEWNVVSSSGGTPFGPTGRITALEFAPDDHQTLYLGTDMGHLYRTTNGGTTAGDWTQVVPPSSGSGPFPAGTLIASIGIDPINSDHIWVTLGRNGVHGADRPLVNNPLGTTHVLRSTDGGTTWADASGLISPYNLPDVPTSAVTISRRSPDRVYVGTDVGAFQTTDGGTTWTAFGNDLPNLPVMDLKYQNAGRLFAGTMGRGIYRRYAI